MNYNINFQVAAVIITALLLYHFLTQKKLHNANVKTFTYILVLSGLYILSDLLGTLTIMNYTAEDEGTVMGILTGIYLLDILIPYILYSCIPDSRENEKKSGALSVICAGITVAMMIAVLGNLGSGGFFCFDSNGVFQKGTGYVFLYFYALVYIVLIMLRMIRSREDYTPEKMSIAGEFLVIEGVCIGVELYTGYIFLSDFGLALGLIFLYLMMNNPGLTDPQLRQLIAAHIDDDSFCRHVIQQDINKIALDLRKAHKDDFFSVPEDNPLEDFLQTAEEAASPNSDPEQAAMAFICKRLKLNYGKLSEEEKKWLKRIAQKSDLLKNPNPQRGRK